MKRLNYNFLFGAIALTGAFAFTSCSSSEDETSAEVNPTYDGRTVKTQFAINIGDMGGSDSQTKTRMTEEATQSGTPVKFLGMNDLKLICFDTDDNNAIASTSKITGLPTLDNNIATGDITVGSKEYKLFYDVQVPEGTNNFLFYGFAPQGTNHDTYMSNGYITATYPTETNKTPADITFALKNVEEPAGNASASSVAELSLDKKKEEVAYILQQIANVSCDGYTVESGSATNTPVTVYWDELDRTKTLGKYFYEFIGGDPTSDTPAGDLKSLAGSSVAVLGTIKTLYSKLNSPNVLDDQTQLKNGTVTVTRAQMGKAIMNKIKALTFQNFTSTKVFKMTEGDAAVDDWNVNPKFPQYLPSGAVQYKWNITDGVASGANKYYVSYNVQKIGSTTNYIDVSKIVYPASLAYSCNSPAMTNTEAKATGEWPKTAEAWQKNTSSYWTGWGNEVTSTTKTIALRNNVNYGVAKLASTFQLASESLLDKNSLSVSMPTGGFKVTGLLIGGQHQYADWEFLPVTTSNPDVTVYEDFGDNDVKVTTNKSAANYCLVFDDYATTANKVKIAVEFENNSGKTFEGHDGIIIPDQKFYLIGELDPDDATAKAAIVWQGTQEGYSDLRFPQESKVRVFIQDHTTTANFKVSSLANAYVNIPDLRTTQMVLGLSVDLTWQSGMTFEDVTIGADESSSTESSGS